MRVLHPDAVEETIMQPGAGAGRAPQLPPLLQLKAISDRFTKLAQRRFDLLSVSAVVTLLRIPGSSCRPTCMVLAAAHWDETLDITLHVGQSWRIPGARS